MSRSTQIIGLHDRAHEFLKNNQESTMAKCSCPDCKTPHIKKDVEEVYDDKTGVQVGMFEDGPDLYKYKLKGLLGL